MKWTESYKVSVNDIDLNHTVSPSKLLKFMQDTADAHMDAKKPSYMDLFENGYAYVLTRLSMSVYAPLFAEDKIEATSWTAESRGLLYNRCYSIRRNGDLIAEAIGVWALVEIATHRVTRVGEVEMDYGGDEPMPELDVPTRLRIPSDVSLSLVGERMTVYADTDLNKHMNNTHYPDILCGYIPEIESRRVVNMVISFVGEAPLGENIKIYMGKYDGTYYFRTKREDGSVNVEAEIIVEDM